VIVQADRPLRGVGQGEWAERLEAEAGNLAAFGRPAFVEGDPERAALLVGAAEGLRRRVGLGMWPLLRREEAELVAQVRQALGADRFNQVFAAGARLNRREAVAAVRDRRGASTQAS
jgi:hypothetical protein